MFLEEDYLNFILDDVGPDFLPILLLADLLRVTDAHTAFDIMKELRRD